MKEKVVSLDKVDLGKLFAGDTLHITTGRGDTAHHYEYLLTEKGEQGLLTERNHLGAVTAGPTKMKILGSGRYTTREQNPVQDQATALTPNWNWLNRGLFMIAAPSDGAVMERIIFDRPNQEIQSFALVTRRGK